MLHVFITQPSLKQEKKKYYAVLIGKKRTKKLEGVLPCHYQRSLEVGKSAVKIQAVQASTSAKSTI